MSFLGHVINPWCLSGPEDLVREAHDWSPRSLDVHSFLDEYQKQQMYSFYVDDLSSQARLNVSGR